MKPGFVNSCRPLTRLRKLVSRFFSTTNLFVFPLFVPFLTMFLNLIEFIGFVATSVVLFPSLSRAKQYFIKKRVFSLMHRNSWRSWWRAFLSWRECCWHQMEKNFDTATRCNSLSRGNYRYWTVLCLINGTGKFPWPLCWKRTKKIWTNRRSRIECNIHQAMQIFLF